MTELEHRLLDALETSFQYLLLTETEELSTNLRTILKQDEDKVYGALQAGRKENGEEQ